MLNYFVDKVNFDSFRVKPMFHNEMSQNSTRIIPKPIEVLPIKSEKHMLRFRHEESRFPMLINRLFD
jgi:hypothetical protein